MLVRYGHYIKRVKVWAAMDKNREIRIHFGEDKPEFDGYQWISKLPSYYPPVYIEKVLPKLMKGKPQAKTLIELSPDTWLPISYSLVVFDSNGKKKYNSLDKRYKRRRY